MSVYKEPRTKVCAKPDCGKEFTTIAPRQKYCNSKCAEHGRNRDADKRPKMLRDEYPGQKIRTYW